MLAWALSLLTLLICHVEIQAETQDEKESQPTIAPLPGPLDENRIIAQQVVLLNRDVARRVTDAAAGKPLRSAVFGVYPARDSDVTESHRCARSVCYRVDIYNYALNASFFVMVDVTRRNVASISPYQKGQPELPNYLVERALAIATDAPEVESALGFKPDKNAAVMSNVKTALNDTECESSRHLCVAPTFVFERSERSLWVIVDLTDETVAGVRWTELGRVKTIKPTEQSIQRDDVYEQFCEQKQTFERGAWSFDYIITSSDGLEISNVKYEGEAVFDSVKLVDWHVSYSERQGFGYSDAIGCPKFSSAAVGALDGPKAETFDHGGGEGFAFVQDFYHPLWPAPCNYRYKQRFEFYADGSFRPAMGQYGRGCGTGGMYRPVLRIKPTPEHDLVFSQWDGANWVRWETERWDLQNGDTSYTEQGYRYRLDTGDKGWAIEPGRGQFPRSRGDHAYVYVTRHHEGEGDADMITIGPCCNTDHRQGPEQFIDDQPEPLDGTGIVLWYVAQLENDNRQGNMYCWAETNIIDGLYKPVAWPCYAGPRFVPVPLDGN